MKKITKFLLPRYTWFVLWFKQWFRNPEGITGFAIQVMNWLMQYTMALAEKLKKQNKKLSETIKSNQTLLQRWYQHPTVGADEWDEVRVTVKKQGLWITIGIIAEGALNYFGINAVIVAKGWGWIALNILIALVLTGFGIYIFKKWFAAVLNKPMYKQVETNPRNYLELVLISFLCLLYEAVIFYLCQIRGVALEGASGEVYVTYFVTLAGMLIPLVAGYLSYERSRYISAYRNTLRIGRTEQLVSKLSAIISMNGQRMEDHFKRGVQNNWALLQEFKVYKENFNIKNNIANEDIRNHFCASFHDFEKVATQRYQKELSQ